jgi:glucose/arabinose dehydrogenase
MKAHNLFIPFAVLVGTLCLSGSACSKEPAKPATKIEGSAQGEPQTEPNVKTQRVWTSVSLSMPVSFVRAPNSTIWWANEQAGAIKRFDGASAAPATVALNLKNRVKSGGERGLLGLALDPDFSKNGRIFVNYTTEAGGKLWTRISGFTSKDKGLTFDPGSEKVLLTFAQPYSNHNGGHIAFGPDGFLYVGVGDGGAGGDPHGNGQNQGTFLGSMLRIDVSKGDSYTSPADNPFAKGGGRPEIFAWGLRNPWKFSFAPDGKLWVGDVGQNKWEEIDIVEKGKNYGWNTMEATHCFNPETKCNQAGLELPVLEYGRKEGQSVTGGFVYRGKAFPGLSGHYIFADFVAGKVWDFDPATKKRRLLIDTDFAIPTLIEDEKHEILVVDYGGSVHRLVPDQK